jgi:hypothetical protein
MKRRHKGTSQKSRLGERDATIAALRQRLKQVEEFKPTVECINALPDPLRRWIMELETKRDPVGDLQRAVLAEDLCRQLEARLLQLTKENEDLQAQLQAAHAASCSRK